MSLTARILAVNVFALAMLAGSFVYLDSYRWRLSDDRVAQFETDSQIIAVAITAVPGPMRAALSVRLGQVGDVRLRAYGPDGTKLHDSWAVGPPTYELRDPRTEPWQKHVARFLDRGFDRIVGAPNFAPFVEPEVDRAGAWDEVSRVIAGSKVESRIREAPDRTPVISTALPIPGRPGEVLLVTGSARDITRGVRAERSMLALVVAGVVLCSVLLSLFLARTIARPLRRLARAAVRVRLGRARDVVMPRLPGRRDEIGMLARALADMSQALSRRIDAVEAFAADVTHELKNPLASLRSAVDSLERVKDPVLQDRLIHVIRDDVVRLDRLITDVADISRLDGELGRARFERIDLGPLIEGLLEARETRGANGDVRVAFARPYVETAVVMGDGSRLARMIANLVDNAVSFSPPGGLVKVGAVRVGPEEGEGDVRITVDDEGPGVPPAQREAIFRRFYSSRADDDSFGRHSGLGLAIARAVAEGHDGRIEVSERGQGRPGARFVVTLPAAPRLAGEPA
ncbi:sensor histidine kinase [Sphingomonas quercus]|nr:ATP-binding protein [Sphingomonas quercus]